MSCINVHFKIVEVHEDKGLMLVEFLADGATKERFGADAGPFIVYIKDSWIGLTEEQLKANIAEVGCSIAQRQLTAIEAENTGVASTLTSLINQTIVVDVEIPTPPQV